MDPLNKPTDKQGDKKIPGSQVRWVYIRTVRFWGISSGKKKIEKKKPQDARGKLTYRMKKIEREAKQFSFQGRNE